MAKLAYVGSELELFSRASNWKQYWKSLLAPYVQGAVLDVGAGIGSTAKVFSGYSGGPWTCLDPDEHFCERLEADRMEGRLANVTNVVNGTLADVVGFANYDTILYIDVLEHINDDKDEMAQASRVLSPGGHLIVLAPALDSLFSPFDRAVGHFRRYSKDSLTRIAPPGCKIDRLIYADSVGLLLSILNRVALKSSMPTQGQIAFWDKVVVPISRYIDVMIDHRLGKTVIGIWTKEP